MPNTLSRGLFSSSCSVSSDAMRRDEVVHLRGKCKRKQKYVIKRMLPDKCDQFASTLAHGDGLVS